MITLDPLLIAIIVIVVLVVLFSVTCIKICLLYTSRCV